MQPNKKNGRQLVANAGGGAQAACPAKEPPRKRKVLHTQAPGLGRSYNPTNGRAAGARKAPTAKRRSTASYKRPNPGGGPAPTPRRPSPSGSQAQASRAHPGEPRSPRPRTNARRTQPDRQKPDPTSKPDRRKPDQANKPKTRRTGTPGGAQGQRGQLANRAQDHFRIAGLQHRLGLSSWPVG